MARAAMKDTSPEKQEAIKKLAEQLGRSREKYVSDAEAKPIYKRKRTTGIGRLPRGREKNISGKAESEPFIRR